jgi:hypothetical protein
VNPARADCRITDVVLAIPSAVDGAFVAERARAALPPSTGPVRLRDRVMPVLAEFYDHVRLFGRCFEASGIEGGPACQQSA